MQTGRAILLPVNLASVNGQCGALHSHWLPLSPVKSLEEDMT